MGVKRQTSGEVNSKLLLGEPIVYPVHMYTLSGSKDLGLLHHNQMFDVMIKK